MNTPYVFKRCTKCGEWLVANNINFHKNKDCKYGLHSKCKQCRNKYHKKWYELNKDKVKEYNEINKDKISDYHKEYRKNNKEKIANRMNKYYRNNKDKILKYNKQYYFDNKKRLDEYHKEWLKTPKGQIVTFNYGCKRRLRKINQGKGIDEIQWFEMMNYFNWKCAYSGKYIGNKENQSIRSIDHIKPLNNGGKHEIWNVVPMDRGLNSSKNDKDMLEWYKEQPFFSEERLQKIYEWQEYAYNKWHKEEIIK